MVLSPNGHYLFLVAMKYGYTIEVGHPIVYEYNGEMNTMARFGNILVMMWIVSSILRTAV